MLFSSVVCADPIALPRVNDPAVSINLFAAEPDIVTPIGMTIDSRGRLLVIESHTHFRPKDYQGPSADRIRIVEDTDGDGRADRFTTFWEGSNATMNLATHPDGSIYVAARNEIFRLRDTDNDGTADQKTAIAQLETQADYPHNGLSGLTVGPRGDLWFGIGENYGGRYTLIGADGKRIVDDGSNAGMIFHCDAQGGGVEIYARGFWNPFGLAFGPSGELFMDDNDPDGRPPCRLIHVAPGGDYGYQYRYGRSGQHPLIAWEGELPGTLGPVAGTGEAPCQMLFVGDRLLVASWGDHRLESYSLTPRGATFTATMSPLIVGGENFRPTGLARAPAPDGTIYMSDWTLKDYQLHRHGRIWRIRGISSIARSPRDPGPAFGRAAALRGSTDTRVLMEGLSDSDPFIAQAAQFALSKLPSTAALDWSSLTLPSQRIGVLAALRHTVDAPNRSFLDLALTDPDPDVRLMAVRWIADEKLSGYRPKLEKAMSEPVLTPRLFAAYLAAFERFDGAGLYIGKPGPSIAQYLLPKLRETGAPAVVRVMALQLLPADTKLLPLEHAGKLARDPDPRVRLEAVRWISATNPKDRFPLLSKIALSDEQELAVRAEAIVGLADEPDDYGDLLLGLAHHPQAVISEEALRSLRRAKLSDLQKAELVQVAHERPEAQPLVDKIARTRIGFVEDRPSLQDTAGWMKIVHGSGDPLAGRRIFFQPAGPGCYRCHGVDGRGANIGPDLSGIGRRTDRQRILESILQPGKEIAPRYTTWSVSLADGRMLIAFLVGENGGKHAYADATGRTYNVEASQVLDRRALPISIMPEGLVQTMTDQELRDLMAFLTAH